MAFAVSLSPVCSVPRSRCVRRAARRGCALAAACNSPPPQPAARSCSGPRGGSASSEESRAPAPSAAASFALLSVLGALLLAADPAAAATAQHAQQPAQLWQLGAEEPDFWLNMERYVRFALGTGLGMFYTVAKPLLDLLGKPQTGIPLVVGLVLLTKLITWTLDAMLGLNDVSIVV